MAQGPEISLPTATGGTGLPAGAKLLGGCLCLVLVFSAYFFARHNHFDDVVKFEDNYLDKRLFMLAVLFVISIAAAAPIALQRDPSRIFLLSWLMGEGKRLDRAIIIYGFALSLIGVWATRAFLNSGDEYDYVFEANTFLAGRLWNPLLPGHEFFSFNHIFEKAGKWVAQYPPGWPLVLALVRLVGLPFWVTNPVLGLLTMLMLARLCERINGPLCATFGLLIYAFSPFAVLNSASFFSHQAAALGGLVFCYYGMQFIDAPRWRTALLCGATLGMVGLIRPFDAVVFAAPFGCVLAYRARKAHYRHAAGIAIGGAPFLGLLFLYNWRVTGSPLLNVMNWGYPLLKLGIHSVNERGHESSLADTSIQAVARLIELAEWTSPILLLGYGLAIFLKFRHGRVAFRDVIFPVFVFSYLFFPDMGGNRYGPRYYFEAYPLLVVTIAEMAAFVVQAKYPRMTSAVIGLLFVHVMTCLVGLAFVAIGERRIIDARMDLYDQVAKAGLHNALVVVQSGTGGGYYMEPRDLVRNGVDRQGDVLYALDLPGRMADLRALYPERQILIYQRSKLEVAGHLVPLAQLP
jgi:hypothetical protein